MHWKSCNTFWNSSSTKHQCLTYLKAQGTSLFSSGKEPSDGGVANFPEALLQPNTVSLISEHPWHTAFHLLSGGLVKRTLAQNELLEGRFSRASLNDLKVPLQWLDYLQRDALKAVSLVFLHLTAKIQKAKVNELVAWYIHCTIII